MWIIGIYDILAKSGRKNMNLIVRNISRIKQFETMINTADEYLAEKGR